MFHNAEYGGSVRLAFTDWRMRLVHGSRDFVENREKAGPPDSGPAFVGELRTWP